MNHMKHLLKEATVGKAALNSQLKKSEELAAQLKRVPQTSLDERQEKGVDNVNKEQSEDSRPRAEDAFDENTNELRCECQMKELN